MPLSPPTHPSSKWHEQGTEILVPAVKLNNNNLLKTLKKNLFETLVLSIHD